MQLRQVSPQDVRPGDFGVVPGTDTFMRLVRWGDRISRPEPHGRYGHAFLVTDPKSCTALEGKPSHVGPVDYRKYVYRGAVFITDDSQLDSDRERIVAVASGLVGLRYDYLDILNAALWDLRGALVGRRDYAALYHPFDYDNDVTAGHRPRALICSVFVAYAWLAGASRDLRDGHKLHRVTPGDLYRVAVRGHAWQVQR